MESCGFEWMRDHLWSGRVRFRPHAVSLDPDGPKWKDAVWVCVLGEGRGVKVQNSSTGHFTELRAEDVLRVEPDPEAPTDGLAHAVVTLR
jgi:hypothetical protein